MAERVLITGGAGFIGSHVADELLAHGYRVRVLDALLEQVHGNARWPTYLDDRIERINGDVRDAEALNQALRGVDAVIHLAARVGVGQSMYELVEYTSANQIGTARLLEALARKPVQRLVVASSMSIYGEGLYRDRYGAIQGVTGRTSAQMKARHWELYDEADHPLDPMPTLESKQPALASNYALGKYAQEQMCLTVAPAYGIPTVALRFFNVYGPRQALSNPYTGVLAIFATRLLNDRPPLIFEDGLQRRDFVNVHDVARACRLALMRREVGGAINIGSGAWYTIADIARALAAQMHKAHIQPTLTGEYRVGDIRHCFADISKARAQLAYEPQVSFEQGLAELVDWLRTQAAHDRVDEARAELAARGLTQ